MNMLWSRLGSRISLMVNWRALMGVMFIVALGVVGPRDVRCEGGSEKLLTEPLTVQEEEGPVLAEVYSPDPPHDEGSWPDPVVPFYIGPSLGLMIDMQHGDPFGEISTAASIESQWRLGYQIGFGGSFGFRFLPEELRFSVHASYASHNGRSVDSIPDAFVIIDPLAEPVVFRVVAKQETSITLITTDLMVGYDILRAGRSVNIFVTGGVSMNSWVSSTATSWQDLVLPEDAKFAGVVPGGRLDPSGRRMYRHEDEPVPRQHQWFLSAIGGLGTRINLSRDRTWLLTPSIYYETPVTPMAGGDFSVRSMVLRVDLLGRLN